MFKIVNALSVWQKGNASMSEIEHWSIKDFYSALLSCYGKYLQKYQIQPDDGFYLEKVYEELGELTRSILVAKGMKPGEVPPDIQHRIDEETADVLCQIIVYVCHSRADVWPTIEQKWLAELETMDENHAVNTPREMENPHVFYEQWCQDFRDINQIFWRVPFIAMTLTGGVVFAVGTFDFAPSWQSAILYFLAICNICFIIIIWRLRMGVMEPMLERIHHYEGRQKQRTSYVVMIAFTVLFAAIAIFGFLGGTNPDFMSTPNTTDATAKTAPAG